MAEKKQRQCADVHRRRGRRRHPPGPLVQAASARCELQPRVALGTDRPASRSTASARRRATGWRPDRRCVCRRPEPAPAEGPGARPKRIIEPLTEDEAEFVREMVLAKGRDWFMLNKPPGPCDAGRDQDRPASGPPARRAGGRSRAAAQARPSARQGHQRRPAGRAIGAGGGAFRQGLFRPDRAQGLLGADRGRARRRTRG